jgi:hypothetical protein
MVDRPLSSRFAAELVCTAFKCECGHAFIQSHPATKPPNLPVEAPPAKLKPTPARAPRPLVRRKSRRPL